MNKKRVRRILTFFIVIGLLIGLIPVRSLLAVSASNDADFQMEGSTLIKYVGTANTVSIPSYVTTIGKNAFEGNTTLVGLTIPDTVRTIDAFAFQNCSALKNVTIGDNVKTIGNSAFADCSSLSSVTIGASVSELGSCSFGGCDSLSSVSISQGNRYLTCFHGAIYGDNGKTLYQVLAGRPGETYTMPESVTKVMPYCLWGCDKIKTFSFSGGFREIPEYAFFNATGLQFVDIPSSISAIDLRAFGSNYNLEEVKLPLSAITIHSAAFEDCPKLYLVVAKSSVGETYAINNKIKFKYSSDYEGTYNFTLENTSSNTGSNSSSVSSDNQNAEESKPDTSTVEGAKEDAQTSVNGDIDHLQADELGMSFVVSGNAFVMMDNNAMNVHDGDAYTLGTSDVYEAYVSNPELFGDGAYPKYTIFENQIADKAYYENSSLEYYVIPDGTTEIGEFAFAKSSISGIAIPEGVKKIGSGAFYQCNQLEYLTLPMSIEEIEPYAFDETKWKMDWLSGGAVSDFYIVGDGILLFYKGNQETVEIPDGIKQIASGCFKNHTEITKITLPDSVEVIGEEAFLGCTSLTTVNGGTHLKKIKDRGFSGCPLDTIRIPAEVKEIGLGAFDYTNVERRTAVAAVFMGTELPILTYGSNSKRLSETDARKKALEQVPVAILWNQNAYIENSILWDENYGFTGFICTVLTEGDTNVTGTLRLVAVSSNAKVSDLPDSVWAFGNRYVIQDTNGLLDKLTNEEEKPSSFYTDNTSGLPECDSFGVSSPVNLSGYMIRAYSDTEREQHLIQTVNTLYAGTTLNGITSFSYTMMDDTQSIPITDLGDYDIKITMQIPNLLTADSLKIVTEDEDGQMEDVPYEVAFDNDRMVTFTVSHFSPYVMFHAGELQAGMDDESLLEEGMGHGEEGEELPAGGTYEGKKTKEVSPITIFSFLGAILLLIIATALWFTKRFHKVL